MAWLILVIKDVYLMIGIQAFCSVGTTEEATKLDQLWSEHIANSNYI